MIRQPRNAPCKCGSGKKFKKCCMIDGKEFDLQRAKRYRSDLNCIESKIIAGMGGFPIWQEPNEPEIAPPRWMTWMMLIALVISLVLIFCVLIWR